MTRRRARVRLRIVVDDRLVRSHTQVHRGTRGLVVCESVVPELGIELHSAYSDGRATQARVEHLVLAPELVDIESAEQDRGSPPVITEAGHSLISHLLRLQELLGQYGHNARITRPGRLERLPDAVRSARPPRRAAG